MAIVCDLDGVVWLADEVIPGAPGAIAALRAAGQRVVFVTNNSSVPVADVVRKLERFGIPAAGDVLTSAMAAAGLVQPGERVQLCAGPGAAEALAARGAIVVDPSAPDAIDVDVVVVGFHRTFDYERLRAAAVAVRRGARLVGTNDDATYPTPDGPIPGGGALLAAVATGAGVAPVVAGKPYPPMAALVRAELGGAPDWVVGDRLDTDGEFALATHAPFALVLSGVTRSTDGLVPEPAWIGADLAAFAATLATRSGRP